MGGKSSWGYQGHGNGGALIYSPINSVKTGNGICVNNVHAAVDLAFNSTQREQIIRALNEIGTNEKLITDIANIFMEDFRNIQQKHAQESNKGAIQHHH